MSGINGMTKKSVTKDLQSSFVLSRSVMQALFFRLGGLLLIFLLQVMLARLMGPQHYGDYTVIITIVNLFLVFSLFGFDSSVLRFLPSYIDKKDLPSANGFKKFSSQVITILSVVSSVGIFIFLLAKSKSFKNISFSEGLFWGILLIPFLALLYQSCAVLRALNKIRSSLMPVYFLLPAIMGLSCLYYYSSYHRLPVDAAMLINLGSVLLIGFYMNRKTKRIFKENVPAEKTEYERGKWLTVSGSSGSCGTRSSFPTSNH